jgi:hypothetical protein
MTEAAMESSPGCDDCTLYAQHAFFIDDLNSMLYDDDRIFNIPSILFSIGSPASHQIIVESQPNRPAGTDVEPKQRVLHVL